MKNQDGHLVYCCSWVGITFKCEDNSDDDDNNSNNNSDNNNDARYDRGSNLWLKVLLKDRAPSPKIVVFLFLCCNIVHCVVGPWHCSSGMLYSTFTFLQNRFRAKVYSSYAIIKIIQ